MKTRLAATIAVFGAFAAFITVSTLAVFTGSDTETDNAFATGTVIIDANDNDAANALVQFSAMAPGDTVTDDLVVTNTGSLALRYAISSTSTNTDAKGLKDQLVLTIKTIDVTTPETPCDNFDGTQLYTGDLDKADNSGALVGSTTQGFQTGDRALAASASETLCFRVELPTATGNTHQNAATTATFTFSAEQTVNNA